MIVYFIRHGETDFNKRCLIQGMSDIPLNDKGVQQAGVAANWFKAQNITFDKVFSSPLVRARKTAAIVSGRTFEAVQPDARIREMDFGVDEGKQYSLMHRKPIFRRKVQRVFRNCRPVHRNSWICCQKWRHQRKMYILFWLLLMVLL